MKNAIFFSENFAQIKISFTFADGEMAEWSNAAVLKTVVPRGTGGSNPSFSATKSTWFSKWIFSLKRLLITFLINELYRWFEDLKLLALWHIILSEMGNTLNVYSYKIT